MKRMTNAKTWKEAYNNLSNEMGYSHIWERLNEIENILGDEYELTELKELLQLKINEQLVMLPCKIGDPVWVICVQCDSTKDCFTIKTCEKCRYKKIFIEQHAFSITMLDRNGKLKYPFYKTYEEAEEKLKELQNNELE